MDWIRRLENLLNNEKVIFRTALAAGIVLSLLSVLFIHDIYRDVANVYAYSAREIANGNFADGWEYRVPMLNILLAGGVSFCGLEPYKATVLVSCLFYVLTLFPLRRFLEIFLTPVQSAWGCLFFITAPKIIRFSVSGLLDSSRYFFLIASLWLLFELREKPRIGKAVLFGLSLAGLSVSRGEELIIAIGILIGLPVLALLKSPHLFRNEIRKYSVSLGIAAFFFLAAITPFCAVNARYTGIFITDARFAAFISKSEKVPQSTVPPQIRGSEAKESNPFADSLTNIFRGGYEFYWIFSIAGMILLCRKRNWKWEHTVLIGIFAVHTVIYHIVGSTYRYSLYLVPLFMPFTITGFSLCCELPEKMKWPERMRLTASGLVCVFLLLIFGFQIGNGMKCVTDRKDAWVRQVANTIAQWGKAHTPNRRVRIAAYGLVEAVYWSGAYSVFNYKSGLREDIKTFRDFDLLLIPETRLAEISGCRDLRPVPLPKQKKIPRKASDRYFLFCRKNISGDK